MISTINGDSAADIEAYTTLNWLMTQGSTRNGPFIGLIDVSHWVFDGNFQRNKHHLLINPLPSAAGAYPISSLSVFPMQYARKEMVQTLRRRGKMFWKCRKQNYIFFTGFMDEGAQTVVCPATRFPLSVELERSR